MTTVEVPVADPHRQLGDEVLQIAQVAASLGREDIAARLRVAVARVTRPTTIICVVGEFKQGKSSLVNALLTEEICPVDDDLATAALTLVRYGPERRVDVRRRAGDDAVVEASDVEHLGDWVSESGNPGNAKGVERVDVFLPNAMLAKGIAIVDTPGMGSLGAGHAAATLSFLPFADALVFVSDASAELSAPEVEFLQRAGELCPNILFALTKIDLHGAWRRIAEIDSAHLAVMPLEPTPVSSLLRSVAVARRDSGLNDQSGFPALFGALEARVLTPAKSLAAARAADEAKAAVAQLETPLRAELDVLRSSDRGADTAAHATAAAAKLEHLRGPGSRWSILVGDRLTDLSNDVTFRFRGALRQTTRDLEAQIEEMKTPKEWEELARHLQTEVAEAVTAAFQGIGAAAQATREEVVELLAEEAGELTTIAAGGVPIDVRTLWSERRIDVKTSKGGQAFSNALTGLRGAQGGILMFGMMSQFLPLGVGAILMSNPVTIGLGVAFGGMQLLDAHKRKIAQRRQQARVSVRQFVDDVQFEIGNAMSETLRNVQRGIRDEFTERVAELQRTYTDAARQAAEAAKRGTVDAEQRAVEVEALLSTLGSAGLTVMGSTP